jgi:RNA polymerase sigma-70 factor (ECF subfamily)
VTAPLDEQSLVERARTESDAFAELYRLYLPRIYAFVHRRCGCRDVAEDVTAATFEQALRSLPAFEWKGGGFGPWLFRIAANELVDHYRAAERARGRARALHLMMAADAAEGDTADRLDSERFPPSDRLLAALNTLNPRYQQAISLRYLAGLSPAEAAEAMGTTKPVMAVTLHRALRALRRTLERPARAAGSMTPGGLPTGNPAPAEEAS